MTRNEAVEAIRVNPLDAEAWLAIGRILADEGDRAKARECFERARALDPNLDHEIRVSLARLDLPEWLHPLDRAPDTPPLTSESDDQAQVVDDDEPEDEPEDELPENRLMKVPLAYRLAALGLLVVAAGNFVIMTAMYSADQPHYTSLGMVLVDLILAIHLLSGSRVARRAAIIRSIIEIASLPFAVSPQTGDPSRFGPDVIAFSLAAFGGIILLLTGRPGRMRVLLGGLAVVIMAFFQATKILPYIAARSGAFWVNDMPIGLGNLLGLVLVPLVLAFLASFRLENALRRHRVYWGTYIVTQVLVWLLATMGEWYEAGLLER